MKRQAELTQYFRQSKKVKLNHEPLHLVTPTFSEHEDNEDSPVEQYRSQYQNAFLSPFSQFKTMGHTNQSETAPKLASRLTFPCQQEYKLRDGTLDGWVTKRPRCDRWPDLPKELMHRIFLYLTLRDCANTALVCRFWKFCYHNVYFNYSFLKEFDSDRFNEKEMQTVFKKAGSKMKHIKKMQEMFKGQRLGPLIQRSRVSANLSSNSEAQGSLLESFSVESKRAGLSTSVFLTDKAIKSICNDSKLSLQFISLSSCQCVTAQGFETLSRCNKLQYLQIHNNSYLNDATLALILQGLTLLNTLIITKCSGLTSQIITSISTSRRLSRLDVGINPQLRFDRISELKSLPQLKTLSLRQTGINNLEIQNLLISVESMDSLNLSGCPFLNDLTLALLRQYGHRLKRLNLQCVPTITEPEIYALVQSITQLKVLHVNNNLLSTRIEDLLKLR